MSPRATSLSLGRVRRPFDRGMTRPQRGGRGRDHPLVVRRDRPRPRRPVPPPTSLTTSVLPSTFIAGCRRARDLRDRRCRRSTCRRASACRARRAPSDEPRHAAERPARRRGRPPQRAGSGSAASCPRVYERSAGTGGRRAVHRPPVEGGTIVPNDPMRPAPAETRIREVTVPTTVPEVAFSDQRLDNGLRVIVAEDHLAPVVAVNLWYDVGSKHEVPGKTGFAHLFEHVMFQGSRHVAKAEHIALVQAAGGTMNGSTWLDRTNYFETLPAHQLDLALWLEADRMATLLDALSQENLDNQREVVKNEKRWSYDNRPYGSFQEKLQAHLFPPEHPYHHSTIGSMDDLDAASLEDVSAFFRTYYAPNNAVALGRRRRRDGRRAARPRALLRGDPAEPGHPAAGRPVAPADARRGAARDRPRSGPAAARPRRLPRPGLRRPAARRARPGRPDPVGREGQPAQPAARPRRADRPGRGDLHARVRRRRVGHCRLGDGPAGRPRRARRGGPPRGAGPARHRARRATTSWPGPRR